MKRAYSASAYARPCERYCRERYPDEADQILRRAEAYYRGFLKELPDLGRNMMARNRLDWFTIVSFYEASGRRMDGEVLLEIKRRDAERMSFLGRFIDGNKCRWICRLFEKVYVHYIKELHAHQAKGEWMDAWQVVLNPDHRTEGFCFHLVGCPIARHARAHGCEQLRPTSAGRITCWRRSCTRGSSARRPKRWAAITATAGTSATKAPRLKTTRISGRSERPASLLREGCGFLLPASAIRS